MIKIQHQEEIKSKPTFPVTTDKSCVSVSAQPRWPAFSRPWSVCHSLSARDGLLCGIHQGEGVSWGIYPLRQAAPLTQLFRSHSPAVAPTPCTCRPERRGSQAVMVTGDCRASLSFCEPCLPFPSSPHWTSPLLQSERHLLCTVALTCLLCVHQRQIRGLSCLP